MGTQTRSGTARGLLGLLAETAVHAGVGTQIGAVDLPIQRERHTGWPTIYGSGLKGVLRDEARKAGWQDEEIKAVFGPEPERPGEARESEERRAGVLAISDARILLFPVRTAGMAFAWITCPLALARLARDAEHAGLRELPSVPGTPEVGKRVLVVPRWPGRDRGAFIEEFVYDAPPSEGLERLADWISRHLMPTAPPYGYWREQLGRALALVHDDDFTDFARHATEIVTRVRLKDDWKTVEGGAPWTEEHLPPDTLLYAFAVAWRSDGGAPQSVRTPGAVMQRLGELIETQAVIQIGGKETVGRGFVALRLAGGGDGQAQ
ncbi:MAG: type III-B CRISPR module RAMP protein Cmr4 [Armatimonadota bacterium]|nr:type III-B CRISPR module RAMP protein Cmr4 [Armatimonadota bacterium]MDR7528727.1 type III-B CRISPR module RAMP protein Cmr4 [Armatimonadota bacterium]